MRWKNIIGNKHEVSDTGVVRNIRTKKELKPDLSGGYKRVLIIVDGKRTHQTVHRLVALAFCDGYEEGKIVNHIDENKLNNNSSNLEWVTHKENNTHGTIIERRVKSLAKRREEQVEEIIEGEVWKSIDSRYQISNMGRCKSKRGILKPERHTSGYLRVSLSGIGRFYLHRLTAEYFLDNSDKTIVNHKDGDKTNNRVDNLEWVTPSENLTHYYQELEKLKKL